MQCSSFTHLSKYADFYSNVFTASCCNGVIERSTEDHHQKAMLQDKQIMVRMTTKDFRLNKRHARHVPKLLSADQKDHRIEC